MKAEKALLSEDYNPDDFAPHHLRPYDEHNLADLATRYVLLKEDLRKFRERGNLRGIKSIVREIVSAEQRLFSPDINYSDQKIIESAIATFGLTLDAVWDAIRRDIEIWIMHDTADEKVIDILCGKRKLDIH